MCRFQQNTFPWGFCSPRQRICFKSLASLAAVFLHLPAVRQGTPQSPLPNIAFDVKHACVEHPKLQLCTVAIDATSQTLPKQGA